MRFAVGFIALALAVATVSGYPSQPANPIIGIFTTPLSDAGPPPPGINANAAVEKYYVDWLQNSGIRVIPFPWNATRERALYLAQRVNGILFPGGGLSASALDEYLVKVEYILNLTQTWNQQGDPFFLWGTCQGFQVLSAAAAKNVSVIRGPYHGMYPLMMPLNFTDYQPRSRLFGTKSTPNNVLHTLRTKNSTLNWHHECVLPQSFDENPGLGRFFKQVSTDFVPGTNVEFVSAIESPTANVFATQFHPERPPYEFSNDIIGHSQEVLAISHYLADFIARRLMMNNHTFDTPQDAEAMNVEQYPLQNYGWGSQMYWVLDKNHQ